MSLIFLDFHILSLVFAYFRNVKYSGRATLGVGRTTFGWDPSADAFRTGTTDIAWVVRGRSFVTALAERGGAQPKSNANGTCDNNTHNCEVF